MYPKKLLMPLPAKAPYDVTGLPSLFRMYHSWPLVLIKGICNRTSFSRSSGALGATPKMEDRGPWEEKATETETQLVNAAKPLLRFAKQKNGRLFFKGNTPVFFFGAKMVDFFLEYEMIEGVRNQG